VGGWNICLCDALREQGGPAFLQRAAPRENVLPLELQEALDQRRPVMMEYLDASERRTRRVVDPIQISRHGEELVLIAHCHLRGDRRNFKLERIVQLTRIEEVSEGISVSQ
jgi:predicted DNA-binding transcriptional regulator YafY